MSTFPTPAPLKVPVWPHNFNAYYLGKMTRSGPITDAAKRGGYAWYTPLKGEQLFRQQIIKLIEEFREVKQAESAIYRQAQKADILRQELLFELADVTDVISQMHEKVPFFRLDDKASGTLSNIIDKWEDFQRRIIDHNLRNPHDLKSAASEYLSYTTNGLSHYRQVNSITYQEMNAAIATKNAEKGKLLHGRTEFIALPKRDEWNRYFRKNFMAIPPHMLNPSRSWQGKALK